MLPVLDQLAQHKKIYARFIKQLRQENFCGDIQEDYASRISTAVDNSIYQVIPEVVLFPKNTQDIEKILMLTNKPRFQSVKFSARGAGTGTNGQSLCQGVIIDSSRYLNQILEVNLDKGYVRVEPGVVLDQLNEVLQKHGVFLHRIYHLATEQLSVAWQVRMPVAKGLVFMGEQASIFWRLIVC